MTRAVDTRCFYVVPRLAADGAEAVLTDWPRLTRSSLCAYPRLEQRDGFITEEVDGDGRILATRIPDANGPWTPSSADHRLLVARDPEDEGGGPYYRLLREGRIQNYDGPELFGAVVASLPILDLLHAARTRRPCTT